MWTGSRASFTQFLQTNRHHFQVNVQCLETIDLFLLNVIIKPNYVTNRDCLNV